MLKKCQVILLPHKDGVLYFSQDKTHLTTIPGVTVGANFAQHIYILSDEEIKEGDYRYSSIQNNIAKANSTDISTGYYTNNTAYKKTIATTDSSLNPTGNAGIIAHAFKEEIPQPSPQFLEVFVREYNKGNTITSVMVEYEDYNGTTSISSDWNGRLKVNSKDNTITIKRIKYSWSREEVIELLLSFNKDKPGNFDCSKWVEQNL